MNLKRTGERSFLLTIFILAMGLGFLFISVIHSATDVDGDGYDSTVDCVDSLQSIYKNNSACDTTATPTLLTSSGDGNVNGIADHTWIKDSAGLWHLYFQWNEEGGNNDTDIAHFTSTDLKSITEVGNALEKATDTYYESIWAPYVIENGGLYYMFFTGVERFSGGFDRQRMGLATSTDLTNWNLYHENLCTTTTTPNAPSGNGCLYECVNDWTTWNDGGQYDEQCRDPMIIRDEANSRWLALNTVKYNDATGATIDVAQSTDLITWTGLGYVEAARKLSGGTGAQKTGGQAENPFITEYNGKYVLIFSDWDDPEPPAHNQYIISDTLDFDSSGSAGWVYQGSIPTQGINANEVIKPFDDTWIISGSISNDNAGYPANIRSLYLRRMIFADDATWTVSDLTDIDCRIDSSDINPGAVEICGDGRNNNCKDGADEASVCNPVIRGGGGPAPPPAVGLGANTVTIDMWQSSALLEPINIDGTNILLYIGSTADFSSTASSHTNAKSYSLVIEELDMIERTLDIKFSSGELIGNLNLQESRKVDLDGDGLSDVEITFTDLIVNRIELTVRTVNIPQVFGIKENFKPAQQITTPVYKFVRDLKRGVSGDDVLLLQQYLNNSGFILGKSGPGSPGNETDYFGPITQNAVISFQEANEINPAVGYFGPISRAHINKN